MKRCLNATVSKGWTVALSSGRWRLGLQTHVLHVQQVSLGLHAAIYAGRNIFYSAYRHPPDYRSVLEGSRYISQRNFLH